MVLDFKVHEQTLEGVPTTSVPRDKSQNYIKLRFHFDKSWDLFKEQGAHITVYCQDKKTSPAVSTPTIIYAEDDWTLTLQDYYANLDDFLIMVVGVNADASVSCPTNALCVTLDKSGTAWTLNPESPDDPAYVQLLAEVNAAIAEVEGDLAKKENAPINIQEDYDSWIAEHPSGVVEDFIKTIADVGKYTFSDYDSEYYYELKDAAQSDEGHCYYGLLEAYDGGTANIIRYVYYGETVAALARETDVELVDKKYLTDNHYVSATVSDAPAGMTTQEVYKSGGKLVTAAGGGGGTADHRLLTNRDAADQHPVSAISGSGTSSANARTGDLYMGNHAIHNVADANPANNLDAVNVQFMKNNIPQATDAKFGGIKASARNAATDTQEVKIDTATGKLYTAPTGGASSEVPMIVNVSKSGDVISADKTFDEIRAAYIGDASTPQRIVFARLNNYEYELTLCTSNVAQFTAPSSGAVYSLILRRTSGAWSESSINIAIYDEVTSATIPIDNLHYPTTIATQRLIDVAIGDTASALSALDNLIGGDAE